MLLLLVWFCRRVLEANFGSALASYFCRVCVLMKLPEMHPRRVRSFSTSRRSSRLASRAITDEELWAKVSALSPMRAETVQIVGPRYPDRGSLKADVFGRRRGDDTKSVADEPVSVGRLEALASADGNASDAALMKAYGLDGEQMDEFQALSIERALGETLGKLRGSRNMTRAFQKVVSSEDGSIRRSEVANASIASTEAKELLMHEKTSAKRRPRSDLPFFSTTMTTVQCAATLETICREMACRVKRLSPERSGGRDCSVIKLRVVRPGPRFTTSSNRRIRALITIREEDSVRTVVFVRKLPGVIPDYASFLSLSEDIRNRFQREWPRVVDALYVRLPH